MERGVGSANAAELGDWQPEGATQARRRMSACLRLGQVGAFWPPKRARSLRRDPRRDRLWM